VEQIDILKQRGLTIINAKKHGLQSNAEEHQSTSPPNIEVAVGESCTIDGHCD
jgi:hypothetical protein